MISRTSAADRIHRRRRRPQGAIRSSGRAAGGDQPKAATAGHGDPAAGRRPTKRHRDGGRRGARPRPGRAEPRHPRSGRRTVLHRAARAGALEDAGNAWADRGCHDKAEARLRQAHEMYESSVPRTGMARVRSGLRRVGTRVRHWKNADRPASGWDSLTDTEHRIADLVAQGLSNHEVASRVFLSPHTVAFHLRTSSGNWESARGCSWRGWPPKRRP